MPTDEIFRLNPLSDPDAACHWVVHVLKTTPQNIWNFGCKELKNVNINTGESMYESVGCTKPA